MKLWILSDLHHELQAPLALPIPETDVCVLAGDIDRPLEKAVGWAAATIAPRMPVVMVPGNHEFYGTSMIGGISRGVAEAAKHPNVHLLMGHETIIQGVRFVGATLWTDYELNSKESDRRERDITTAIAMANAAVMLRDHTAITITDSDPEHWTPEDARAVHKIQRSGIEGVLRTPFDGHTVVVTHHGVHPRAIDCQYTGSPLNSAFVSDLTGVIERYQPRLWVHGHIHNSARFMAGQTEIVCNPRGYGDENLDFAPGLMVEI